MRKFQLSILWLLFAACISAQTPAYRFLVGTYTNTGKSKGIYSLSFNPVQGQIAQTSVAEGISNPSYLAISNDKKFVYSVSESEDGSSVSAFNFDESTGKLRLINQQLTESKGPCYISTIGAHVLTANYGGGSISVFSHNTNGFINPVLQVEQHTGKSIDPERQNEPHVHQVLVAPDGKYILANDLGTDHITTYQYNPASINEVIRPVDSIRLKAGSGPRHGVFSKDGKRLYVVQEMDGTVTVLAYANGHLKKMQETTLDRKPGTVNRAADIHLSPDGRFLYVTNRGSANNISCFAVDNMGKLSFVQQISTQGDGPRNFAITPDGKYILVGHQFTNNIVVFKRDAKTGKLSPAGINYEIGAPVCIQFY